MFQTIWAIHNGQGEIEYWTSLSTATRHLIQQSAHAILSDSLTGEYPCIKGIQPLENGKAKMTDYRFYVDTHMLSNISRNIGTTLTKISLGDWSPLLQQCVKIQRDV